MLFCNVLALQKARLHVLRKMLPEDLFIELWGLTAMPRIEGCGILKEDHR